jgi:hypothetical protein
MGRCILNEVNRAERAKEEELKWIRRERWNTICFGLLWTAPSVLVNVERCEFRRIRFERRHCIHSKVKLSRSLLSPYTFLHRRMSTPAYRTLSNSFVVGI